jgi:hypothetical protein
MSTTTTTTTTTTVPSGITLIKSFTSYWGDAMNGLWVTWGHDSTASGDKTMAIKLTANLYSAAPKYFLFG